MFQINSMKEEHEEVQVAAHINGKEEDLTFQGETRTTARFLDFGPKEDDG